MGTHLIKEQSAASVPLPPPGKIRLFFNLDNSSILSTKDSAGTVRPAGVGTADELATTGAAVDVSAASPPTVGARLRAITPTAAVWAQEWSVTTLQVGPGPYAASVDELIPVDVSAGPIQINLPAGHVAGQKIGVKLQSLASFAVTVDADGVETIDGAATLVLAANPTNDYGWVVLVSNGTNWMQLG